MGIFLSKAGDMWRGKGMERGRETRKIRRKGVAVTHSRLGPWKVRWEEGGLLEAQSPAYTTVPAGKRRYFSLRLNPYGLLFRGTVYVFCLSLDTAYFSKAKFDLSNTPGLTTVIQERSLQRWVVCNDRFGENTEPSCCHKQVWPTKKRKLSWPGGKIWQETVQSAVQDVNNHLE